MSKPLTTHAPYTHADVIGESLVDPSIEPFDVSESVLKEYATEVNEKKPKDLGFLDITDSNNIGMYSYPFTYGFGIVGEKSDELTKYHNRYKLRHSQ